MAKLSMWRLRQPFFLSSLLVAAPVAAQEPLVTDRPDFTESVNVVDRGHAQLEGGTTLTRSGETDELAIGELLLRVGIAPRVELRLATGSFLRIDGPDGHDDGFEDGALGAKFQLAEDAAALLVGTSVPTGSIGPSVWEPELKLLLARDAGHASLGANLGWIWSDDGEEHRHRGLGSVTVGLPMGDRGGAFLETFGFVTEDADGEEAYADAGLTRLLSDDLQLDARLGVGLSGDAADWFVGIGAARRW